MTLKEINKNAVISSLEDYIAWHSERVGDSYSIIRAKKGKEILSIVKGEKNNQGFHDEMVEAIYTLYKECEREVNGCKRQTPGLSFTDAFYYIYHVLVNEVRIENKIKRNIPCILEIYKDEPEKSMKIILNHIVKLKEDENNQNNKQIEECKELLLFLLKLI